jgi:hypothetical protein
VPVADLSNLDTDAPIEAVGVWMAPVSAALAQKVTLYSDDVVLRMAARAHGVPAFGTLALLDTLAQGTPVDGDTVVATLTTLFENYVVDLPITTGFLLSYGRSHGPAAAPILIALSRPATWMVDHLMLLQTVIHLVRAVPGEDRQGLAELVTAAATGLAGCFEPQQKVLSWVGVSVLLDGTGLDADAAAVVVPAIGTVAARYGVDLLPVLRAHVMAALTDPGGAFNLTEEAAQQQVDAALGEPQAR